MAHYTCIFFTAPEGGYDVKVPAIDAITWGRTFEEALERARDAIEVVIASVIDHDEYLHIEQEPTIVVSLSIDVEAIRAGVAAENAVPART